MRVPVFQSSRILLGVHVWGVPWTKQQNSTLPLTQVCIRWRVLWTELCLMPPDQNATQVDGSGSNLGAFGDHAVVALPLLLLLTAVQNPRKGWRGT